MKLVLGTTNPDKVKEIRAILQGVDIDLLSLDSLPEVRPAEEVGRTFEENARLKAGSIRNQTGLPALADDSGLEVDALGGLPGVRSARFAGEQSDYAANNRRLLTVLEGLPRDDRAARFVCVACLAYADGNVFCARGILEGVVIEEPRGAGGFGYDPLFLVPELNQTLAEVGREVKNRISHRARALEGIHRHLLERGIERNLSIDGW